MIDCVNPDLMLPKENPDKQKVDIAEVREKNKPLIRVAGVLAYIFDKCKGINSVYLTGSLARDEAAKDVDLLILHENQNEELTFIAHLNRPDGHKLSGLAVPTFAPIRLVKCITHIAEIANVKVDLVFAHRKVVDECGLLKPLIDVYKTIFSEIPCKIYIADKHAFGSPQILHKDGQCCRTSTPWQERKKLRDAGKLPPSSSI